MLTRDKPLEPEASVLLVVDMQNYVAHLKGSYYQGMNEQDLAGYRYFFQRLETIVPNIARLQQASRHAGIEVMYCVIRSLTDDGRDRGLDYRITGFHVPPGSWDGEVIETLAPVDDEIVFSKTSSSVFISTNIDYVLRSMEKRYVVMAGIATDQCVESAVRDACDLGYLVTLVTDACGTYSEERQQASETAIKGYCRQLATAELLAEIESNRVGRNDP
jgi:nicotinamidase-related amidase